MTIDDVLHQFRATGHAQVGFSRGVCHRDLVYAVIGLVLAVALTAYSVHGLVDAFVDAPVIGWVRPLLVVATLLPLGAIVIDLFLLRTVLGRRDEGWPGLVLSPEGVTTGGLLRRARPVLPWARLGAVQVQQRGSGSVVLLTGPQVRRYLPRGLSYPPEQLCYLLQHAQQIAVAPPRR